MLNNTFKTLLDEYLDTLVLYVPIVKRVHGSTHPEFNDVAHHFEKLHAKLASKNYDFTLEFANLRKVTNNYLIPDDVCETYAAVYEILAKLDKAYKVEYP